MSLQDHSGPVSVFDFANAKVHGIKERGDLFTYQNETFVLLDKVDYIDDAQAPGNKCRTRLYAKSYNPSDLPLLPSNDATAIVIAFNKAAPAIADMVDHGGLETLGHPGISGLSKFKPVNNEEKE